MLHKLFHPHLWFTFFKYVVYALLCSNVVLFFQEEWLAANELFANGMTHTQLIEAFAATTDTAAWIVLLLLFELETSVLPDDLLQQRRISISLHGIRMLCSVMIVYSFYGYTAKWLNHLNVDAIASQSCALVGQGWSLIETLDQYVPLTADNCSALQGADLFRLSGSQIVSDAETIDAVQELALVDVLNAGAWILIVIVLELDVRLQLHNKLRGAILWTSTVSKGCLYVVLLAAAAYWWWLGDFLDFWDAFLWLIAFVFIELNLFQWGAEIRRVKAEPIVRA